MPPSRKNLILIACLCVITIYIASSVRFYQSLSYRDAGNRTDLAARYFPYAPYIIPQRTDPAFYDRESTNKPATKTAIGSSVDELGVSAKAYLVGDLQSGKVLFEKNARATLPVASMSKLITAFVATDVLDPKTVITITRDQAGLPADTSFLLEGEKFEMKELLYPLLLSSSNVAAEALASGSHDRSNFLEQMSSYAWEVGMPSSFFADPSGLDPRNAASARGLFALAQYLFKSRPDILAITRIPLHSIATTTDHGRHEVVSTHPFVNDPNFIGGKTGRTEEARETMMTLMKVNNRPLALIVLGSEFGKREGDTRILLEQAKRLIK